MPNRRGKLKLFFGYAPGVGKTYAMLDEALRRRKRGQDVVVGIVDAKGRRPVQELLDKLEEVPPRVVAEGANAHRELDVRAVVERYPDVALVEDLAHANAPGSKNAMRWQDVEELLRSGVSVLSTLNVQHLESLNDQIRDLTGLDVTETVPDRVLHDAEEVELVDLTPRALVNRLVRGDVYPKEQVTKQVSDYFREANLQALRELALREAAECVDEELLEYRKESRIQASLPPQERVMICIGPSKTAQRLIRRGWRTGQHLHGKAVAVYVEGAPLDDVGRRHLEEAFALAERLGVEIVTLHGEMSAELIRYAKENGVTQLIVGQTEASAADAEVRTSLVADLVHELRSLDILVAAAPSAEAAEA
jgi:two-component system, OmpR family, sensor histidine kinase KdpD